MEGKVAKAAPLLSHSWVRDYFAEFMRVLAARRTAFVACQRVEHVFTFFAKLDATHERPEELSVASLFRAFGAKGGLVGTHSMVLAFLKSSQKVPSTMREDLAILQFDQRIDRIIQRQAGTWYCKLLQDLREAYRRIQDQRRRQGWTGDQSRCRPRTVVSAMTAAERFFQFASAHGAESLLSLEQQHIDLFLGAYPGYRCAFAGVFHRLKRIAKSLRRLRVEIPRRTVHASLLLGPDEQRTLHDRCVTASEQQLGLATAIILLLIFPVSAVRVLRLRRRDLTEQSDGTVTIRFHRVDVPVPQDVTSLIRRYLDRCRGTEVFSPTPDDAFLFPGRVEDQHRHPSSLRYFIPHIKLSQLFASALYGTFKAGLRQPSVLTDAFGISPITVVTYLALFEPQVQHQAARTLAVRATWIQSSSSGITKPSVD